MIALPLSRRCLLDWRSIPRPPVRWELSRCLARPRCLPARFALCTALFWGTYGPLLQKGHHFMGSGRLRPFICVGIAYLLVAIIGPIIVMHVTGMEMETPKGKGYAARLDDVRRDLEHHRRRRGSSRCVHADHGDQLWRPAQHDLCHADCLWLRIRS